MAAKKGNGHNAGHVAPAKTISQTTSNFIAIITNYAKNEAVLALLFFVMVPEAVATIWGALK
jgi:hypothetical protein